MKNIIIKYSLLMVLIAGLLSCNKRENYSDLPTLLNVLESVTINGKEATIDHLSGDISISLPGDTDLSSVTFNVTAANGVIVQPADGSTLDLTIPVSVTADNGTSVREYFISAKLLPSKIAFLGDGATIEEISDDDVKEAAMWTQATYGSDFIYIPFSELTNESMEGVNVLFYMHDQVGSSAQPQELLDRLNVLSKFFVQGGKIVAGQLGTGLVEELGRDPSGLRTIIGTGEGGDNPDTWAVGFTDSELSNIITDGAVRNDLGNIDVINGGYKEDHNAMWNLGPIDVPKYANFQALYDAEVLASWDWALSGEGFAGIIFWAPSGRFNGSIISIGIGGMEWHMNDGRENPYAQNIRTIYRNSIDYLKGL